MDTVSGYLKLELIQCSKKLRLFTFQEDNVDQFNTELWAVFYDKRYLSTRYPYTNQLGTLPFQHLLWARSLSKGSQVLKFLIHAIYQITVNFVILATHITIDSYANNYMLNKLFTKSISTLFFYPNIMLFWQIPVYHHHQNNSNIS